MEMTSNLLIEESSTGRKRYRGRPSAGRTWFPPVSGYTDDGGDGGNGDGDAMTNCPTSRAAWRSNDGGWTSRSCKSWCRPVRYFGAASRTLEDGSCCFARADVVVVVVAAAGGCGDYSVVVAVAADGIRTTTPFRPDSESDVGSHCGDSSDREPRSRPGCTPQSARTWSNLIRISHTYTQDTTQVNFSNVFGAFMQYYMRKKQKTKLNVLHLASVVFCAVYLWYSFSSPPKRTVTTTDQKGGEKSKQTKEGR